MGERRYWTPEEDWIVKTKKRDNESWREFTAREMPHRTHEGVRIRSLRFLNVRNDDFRTRKYFFNKDAWKTFTPESCYWAGWLAADGCVRAYSPSSGSGYSVLLDLKSTEFYQLEKFKAFCEFTGPLQKETIKIGKSGNNAVTRSLVINVGHDWVDDLRENFSIIPRKTHVLKPPKIENPYLIHCFILGYLDGDGCVHLSKRSRIGVSAACASPSFADWLQEQLNEIVKNSSLVNKKRNRGTCSGCPRAGVNGVPACALIDYFRQFPLPKLDRKWNVPRVVDFIEDKKRQFPDKFIKLEIPEQFK